MIKSSFLLIPKFTIYTTVGRWAFNFKWATLRIHLKACPENLCAVVIWLRQSVARSVLGWLPNGESRSAVLRKLCARVQLLTLAT